MPLRTLKSSLGGFPCNKLHFSPPASPSVSLVKGRPATTSLEVAKFFGKRHDSVLRDVRSVFDVTPENFRLHNFVESSYINEQGKEQPSFILYRDGFMLLVMGYTGKKAMQIKIAYIEAFNQMEAQVLGKLAGEKALPATTTPSTAAADRRPLDKLVKVWAQQSGTVHAQAWTQVNAHFNLDSVVQLPVEWIPDAIAFVEGKIAALAKLEGKEEQKALPEAGQLAALKPVGHGANRVQSKTELRLLEMLTEANNLDNLSYKLEDFFTRLSAISGPLNLQAIEAMRRTDDRVTPDSLIQTMHYHRWYAREKILDAVNSARDACRSAIVVARLLGA